MTKHINMRLPAKMAKMRKDERGYPIPFTQFIDPATRKPDFRTIDAMKVMQARERRLCAVCGQKLGTYVYFIGGPKCVHNGYFADPGMHQECALFAVTTCPHLATAKGKYMPKPKGDNLGGVPIQENTLIDPDKCALFAVMKAKKYETVMMEGHPLVKAKLPWKQVWWYRDGKQITLEQAVEILEAEADGRHQENPK